MNEQLSGVWSDMGLAIGWIRCECPLPESWSERGISVKLKKDKRDSVYFCRDGETSVLKSE